MKIAAHLAPFYLREHSKRVLRGALYNDSKFLADINVMDYSLVCGVSVILLLATKRELSYDNIGWQSEQRTSRRHSRSVNMFYHYLVSLIGILTRLYSDLHLGQEVRKLGQRVCLSRGSRAGRTYHRYSQTVSTAVHQRNGTLFSLGMNEPLQPK